MNLAALLPLIEGLPAYRRLVEKLGVPGGRQRVVVGEAAKPYILAALQQQLGVPLLVVTPQPEESRRLYDQLLAWCSSSIEVMWFPEPDTLPYERLNSDPSTQRERLATLFTLSRGGGAPLVVTSVAALTRKTVPYADFVSAYQEVVQGGRSDRLRLLSQCEAIGYQVERAVELPGTIARRGGIVDIYPPNLDLPARIEFCGDRLESIRLFDPASQKSVESVAAISIAPAREFLLPRNGARATIELSSCTAAVSERMEEEMALLLEGHWLPSLEFYASLFNTGILLDYLPPDSWLVLNEPTDIGAVAEGLEGQAAELRRQREQRGELPCDFPVPYFTWAQLSEKVEGIGQCLILERWPREGEQPLPFTTPPSYGGKLLLLLKEARDMLRKGYRLVIVSHQASRLSELLAEQEISAPPLSSIEQVPSPASVALVQGSLFGGWVMRGDAPPLVLLTDSELFGFTKQRRLMKPRAVRRQGFLSELSLGDYVVHIDHGIAEFAGMNKLCLDEVELYLPSDQVDRLSRYSGAGGGPPALSRLGGQEWARSKRRVKESVGDLAQELLDLYAAREVIQGLAFSPDAVWQQELEASFPYLETPDQLEAVSRVKEDMERDRPMDRLVCGDVGYGKTEVAIRAAFKAVLDGRQVAVVVPTTILAQQHFSTFSERLAAFPVKVEMLSRFRSEKEQGAILDELAQGKVDICIGTHRLLQKDVSFSDLGLLIIDEEQRFGVAHKERLKGMRREVDVLTLTATPIPRTLHMSLAGVRDMSIMETPPEGRLPVKTYIAEYDERVIREAILRELERNGQVFFVHNRVQTIGAAASSLETAVPEARVAIAHGQLPEEWLERVMLDFANSKFEVLVCTTIIESGLDMPNVNTLIVDDSDRLGLTQLYQLRGRVGRGANSAYAYFLFDRGKSPTLNAQKRLQTISEASELGAGFRIAMRDLEIRGAGNLLGAEQSGHIEALGFDLYCRLLAEAVEGLKARGAERAVAKGKPTLTSIELPLESHIPEEYVADLSTRLALYQRIAKLESIEEVEDMAEELDDRFGHTPVPVRNLLYTVKMKALAAAAGVQTISGEGSQVVLKVGEGQRIDRYLRQGDGVRVGSRQARLDTKRLGKGWTKVLEKVLLEMAP